MYVFDNISVQLNTVKLQCYVKQIGQVKTLCAMNYTTV